MPAPAWLRDSTYVVIDTETSHKDPTVARIFEIGALRVSRGVTVGAITMLVRQSEEVIAAAGEALAVNGIAPDEIRAGVRPETALGMLHDFVAEVDFVTGHNIFRYDVPVVDAEYRRYYDFQINWPPLLCTQALAWGATPKCYAMSIKKLCAEFKIEQGQAHRAFGDVLSTNALLHAVQTRHRLTSVEEAAARCLVWHQEVAAWFAAKGAK